MLHQFRDNQSELILLLAARVPGSEADEEHRHAQVTQHLPHAAGHPRRRDHGACLARVTVLALVILFAVYAFIASGLQVARAFSSATAGPVLGHLLLGLADLAAGVIALAWPGPTALVLVLIVGSWAVIAGFVEFFAAFSDGEPAGTRALFLLGGLVSIAFGVVLFARPGMGAVTLALLFGLFNLFRGVSMLVQGIELRRIRTTMHPVLHDAHAA